MARHNVIFGRDKELHQPAYAGFGQQTAAPQYGQQPQQSWQPYQAPQDDLESIYARPAATGHDTGRMTMRDALNAITATLGVIMVVGAVVTFLPTAVALVMGPTGAQIGLAVGMGALIIGLVGSLVLGLVNAFKRQPSPVLVVLYAVFEGLLLGGLSGMMEMTYPGIALQAVLATFAVAGTVLVFFRMGILRTSPLLTKIFMVAMVAYLIFGLVNIGFMIFAGYSLRSGLIGMIIGGLAVCMASYALVMDFEEIQAGVGNVARGYAWRCAFGVAATLVWMYVEILRIIAILRGSD